jgi:hypothetical protein
VSFIAVATSGARSCTPETEVTRASRPATTSGSTPGHSIRVTRCPPAECPASRSGPGTSAATAATARATAAVISAMRASGARG